MRSLPQPTYDETGRPTLDRLGDSGRRAVARVRAAMAEALDLFAACEWERGSWVEAEFRLMAGRLSWPTDADELVAEFEAEKEKHI